MMNSDACSKRASECLKAAELSSDPNRQQSWRKLSDLWLIWSDVLSRQPRSDSSSFDHRPARQPIDKYIKEPANMMLPTTETRVGQSTAEGVQLKQRRTPTAAVTGVFLNPWRVRLITADPSFWIGLLDEPGWREAARLCHVPAGPSAALTSANSCSTMSSYWEMYAGTGFASIWG
jgi:hypothetical protein